MAEFNKCESNKKLPKEDNIIYEQTNPSFHDTPEDAKNYKSLQTKHQITLKAPPFVLKPSILTQQAEELRTDKAAVKNISTDKSVLGNKFLVLGNDKKHDFSEISCSKETPKREGEPTEAQEVRGFVFGQNIFARVVTSDNSQENNVNKQGFKELAAEGEVAHENGEVDGEALRKNAEVIVTQKNTTTQQLEEAEMITGEEHERSVLRLSGKIFQFSNERQEWVEKGFCFVHVNDSSDKTETRRSRLVARSKGGLKVIINTFIWAEMVLAKASDKSLRITAQSEEGVRSYLLTMLNNNDADTLFHQLNMRKVALIDGQSSSTNKNSRKRELKSSNADDDDCKDVDGDDDDSAVCKKKVYNDDE